MGSLCIIPARGGSKRIPRKNIKDFLGKPSIAYAIETAINSKLFSEVMVSTDDEEIARVSQEYGASVPFLRSKKNSDDFSGTDDVLLEVLNQYNSMNRSFEFACCIYPVNPFVNVKTLQTGYEKLISTGFDTVFTAVRYSYPVQRALRLNGDKAYMIQPEHFTSRSQDLEPTFHDAAQFYWFRTNAFFRNKRMWSENSGIIEINELEVQDIDNDTDWKLAELKFNLLSTKHEGG
jgi:N-acylneuraminate cytidylyltransferase